VTGVTAPGGGVGRRVAGPTIAILAAAVAIVAVAIVVDPFGPSLHDPDAAASVLYFDRIMSGRHVEVFVPTTPKPLLTVLYGVAWEAFHDWRLLGFLTLAAFGVAAGAAAAFVARVAGPAAAVFVVIALATSSAVVGEVAHANSVIWGLACWALAGLALSGGPRRAWALGLALAAAASFRNESYPLVALATAGVVLLAITRGRAAAGRWSPVLLGWLALPVALVHDLLRTGDPLAWLKVPAGYTAITTPDLRPTRPLDYAGDVVARFGTEPVLVVLAVVGVVWLVRRRELALAAGLLGLTVGITALIGVIAWRGVSVTPRYFEQVELGLIGAAAIGVGGSLEALRGMVGGRTRPGSAGRALPGATLVGAATALALLVTLPSAPFDADLAARLATGRVQSADVAVVLPALEDALAADTTAPPPSVTGPAGLAVVDAAAATLFVPRPLWTRLSLELHVPLTRLADSWLAFRDAGALASIRPGQTVYHDRSADAPPELFAPLEVDRRTILGRIGLEPILADAARGVWLIRVIAVAAPAS
jgi:hypothetical protein